MPQLLLPKRRPGKRKGATITLPESLWEEVDAIAVAQNYSRNEVVEHFLEWALEEYGREVDLAPSLEQIERAQLQLRDLAKRALAATASEAKATPTAKPKSSRK